MNLYPIIHGNQARVAEFIGGIRELGYSVVLIVNQNNYGVSPHGRQLKKVISEMKKRVDILIPLDASVFEGGNPNEFDVAPYADAVQKAVSKYKPIAVIAEYIWMAPVLDKVNSAIKMIDIHDIMHIRKSMYAKQGVNPWVMCTEKEEIDLLKKADVIISIQKKESKILKKILPGKKVVCVAHYQNIKLKSKHNKSKNLNDIIMIVGSDNPSNRYSISQFIEEAWPLILEACPKAELHVYGRLADKLPDNIAGVKKKGFVKNTEKAYNEAKVVVNPTLIGTGLKIKTVEALSYGKALVTTSLGADGIEEGAGKGFILEDNLKKFAKDVIELLKNGKARAPLERNALQFANTEFSRESVFGELIKVLHS